MYEKNQLRREQHDRIRRQDEGLSVLASFIVFLFAVFLATIIYLTVAGLFGLSQEELEGIAWYEILRWLIIAAMTWGILKIFERLLERLRV